MIDPFRFFDKIYCINLDRRKDRWACVQKQFDKIGLLGRVERVSAVEKKDKWQGCLESHIKVIKKAMHHNKKYILIFEDDIEFINYNTVRLEESIKDLFRISDWQLFYLGGRAVSRTRKISNNILKGSFYSTHAYAMNVAQLRGYSKMVVPIDIWYANNLRSYCLYPMMVTQSNDYSDITNSFVNWKTSEFKTSLFLSRFIPDRFMVKLSGLLKEKRKFTEKLRNKRCFNHSSIKQS